MELAQAVKSNIEDSFPDPIWFEAEVASFSVNARNGHCYLELIDKDPTYGQEARMRGTIWNQQFRVINHYFQQNTGQPLAKGLRLMLCGELRYHEQYGLSVNIRDVDASFSVGLQHKKKEEILVRLASEGLLDAQKELALPAVMQNIAIISSSTAAGFQDFVDQLDNNPGGYHFNLTLFNTTMQGDGTEASVCAAFEAIADRWREFDCVALMRGGGGDADLFSFDSYHIGFAIADCNIPVLTGIGHERDWTVPDFVANTRLKTPTAVAAFLIEAMTEYDGRLYNLEKMAIGYANGHLSEAELRLERIQSFLVKKASQTLPAQASRLSSLCHKIQNHARLALARRESRLDLIGNTLTLLDPANQLRRGYTITSDAETGRILRTADEARKAKVLKTHFQDGDVLSTKTLKN